jgi:peptide/nickel transport system substrate-binding protein
MNTTPRLPLGKVPDILFSFLLIILAAACSTQPQPVEPVRTDEEPIPGPEVAATLTRLASETPEAEATATRLAAQDADPVIFVKMVGGDISTLDPALAYDITTADALQNIVEGVIANDPKDPNRFVPALAEQVPSVENGLISADGLTYTFNIREGVEFHEGGTLEPHDVAYSLQRQLIQSDPTSPAWLFIEPILGYSSGDITEEIGEGAYIGDPQGLLASASPEELALACGKAKEAITFDDEAGTVTIKLVRPWSPFIPTMVYLGVLDREWAIEQGAWDGSCEGWAEYYAPGYEGSELHGLINGTGPYRLENWMPDDSYTLTAFDGYWRTNESPVWEGGPWGVARIPTVIVRVVSEWSTRLAALQADDADYVDVPFENESQVDALVGEFCEFRTGACEINPENPDGLLRKWDDLTSVSRGT